MTDYASLVARLDAYDGDGYWNLIEDAKNAIEELRKDAARLDWCMALLIGSPFDGKKSVTTDTGCGCCENSIYVPADLDDRLAIDAALAASPVAETEKPKA